VHATLGGIGHSITLIVNTGYVDRFKFVEELWYTQDAWTNLNFMLKAPRCSQSNCR